MHQNRLPTILTNNDMEQNLEPIRSKIYEIRGQRVMLDRDLAELYGVDTSQLKRSVKRNLNRFMGDDFMMELSHTEILRCQIGTSSWGGSRYGAFAFTELGVAMLSSVLHSETAIEINREIMRVFVAIRHITHITSIPDTAERFERIENEIKRIKQDMEDTLADQNDINESTRAQLDAISEALAELQPREPKPRRRIGFIQEEE